MMRVLSALLLLMLLAPVVRADDEVSPEDKAAARALFDEGVQLLKAGKAAQACPKFEESLVKMNGVGTRGKLAECYEALGRYASAYRLWREVAALSRAAGEAKREQAASAHAQALEPKVPTIAIELPSEVTAGDVEIRRDDKLVEGDPGKPVPVDPGTHVIDVKTADERTFHAEVDVTAGQKLTVKVKLHAPEPVATPEPEPKVPAPREAAAAVEEPRTPAALETDHPAEVGSGRRTAAWVLMGVGVGAFATAGVLSVVAVKADDAGDTDKALARANLATGFVIGGVACAGTGLILWLTAPSNAENTTAWAPAVGPGMAGAVVRGSF